MFTTIAKIWSLDLAYVDKLAKENKDVKYLLVAVDCLSRYLRVELFKSKYATTTADAFKKMIKSKRPKKVWVDAGTEFKGSFGTLCQKIEIELMFIKLSARKHQHLWKEIYDRSRI